MPTISIAMIAHNEAVNLPRSLSSVQWADEIVVVDTDSNDNTGEVARQFGAKVFCRPNERNLNINKNFAIERCSGDWVLVLDADEVVLDTLAGEIRKVIQTNDADGYLIPRRNYVMGKWLRFGSQYPDYQLRLFRRGKGRFAAVHIHERLQVDGKVKVLSQPMEHYPYISIESLVYKGVRDSEFEARFRLERGAKVSLCLFWFNGIVKPYVRFIRRYIFKGGFLDGVPGLIIALFDAWNATMRWMRIWEYRKDKFSSSDIN